MSSYCYFKKEYDTAYTCSYTINEDGIFLLEVDYDIDGEAKYESDVIRFGSEKEYEPRDITVIDDEAKKSYILKSAEYRGSSSAFGGGYHFSKCKFEALYYFTSKSLSDLNSLPETPRIKLLSVYSKTIMKWRGNSDCYERDNEDSISFIISKKPDADIIEIKKNNIGYVEIKTDWKGTRTIDQLMIDFSGLLRIHFNRKVKYDDISSYLNELIMYMQLYEPGAFTIDGIRVETDEGHFDFHCPTFVTEKKTQKVSNSSVKCTLAEFLQRCYQKIPYRNSKPEIRNIPYVVVHNYRGLEDNFLMYFRFIETYYKKQQIKGIQSGFIKWSLDNNYKLEEMSDKTKETIANEIVSLRNRYVHSGYYLKNNSLRVNRENEKGYTVNNIGAEWIYEKTKILRAIVIDIIFSNMLEFDSYNYK